MVRVVSALAFSLAIGCGGGSGDGDDDDGGGQDASVDAPVAVDAAVDAAAEAVLGQSCMGNSCPSGSQCVVQENNGPGYCSIPCGTSQVLGVKPTEGDAACADIYDNTVGTPVCGMPTSLGPPVQWFCVIDCSADDMCPSNLTCQDYGAGQAIIGRYCLR